MKTAQDWIKASIDDPGSHESCPTFDLAAGDEVGNTLADLICAAEDSVTYVTVAPDDTPAEVTDAWGTTDDGDEWRVIVTVVDVETRIESEAKAHAIEGIKGGCVGRWKTVPESNFELLEKIIGRVLTRDERKLYVSAFNEVCDDDLAENYHYTLNKHGIEAIAVGVEKLAKPGCDPTAWHREAEYAANEQASEAHFFVRIEIGAQQSSSGNPEIFSLTEADFDLTRVAE